MRRIFELWVGSQRSGKTYQLRRRALALAERPMIRTVHVIAPPGEWLDICDSPGAIDPLLVDLAEWSTQTGILLWDVPLDEHGRGDRRRLDRVLEIAVGVGDCAVVIDEAWSHAPPGQQWRGSGRLLDVIVRGRHLETWGGDLRPTHILMATQYPRSIHHQIREQADTIMIGRLHGDLSHQWVRAHCGSDAERRVRRLGEYQWTAGLGRDPRRG